MNTKLDKEINEYQTIIEDAQKIIEKLKAKSEVIKNIENEKIKTEHKKPKLSDFKRLYFKGDKILEENHDNIELTVNDEDFTKTTQKRFSEYSKTYDIPLDIHGIKVDDKVQWCKEITYKGINKEFKNNRLLLAK